MSFNFTEANYENAIIEIFRDTLGYSHIRGADVQREYADPLYRDELLPALRRINPTLPEEAIDEAVRKLRDFEGDLVGKNKRFTDYLQNGLNVNYFSAADRQHGSAHVQLVDYANASNNTFTVSSQWTFVENSEKRPDLIVFLNGLPVVVFELKSPSREETDVSAAYRQLRNYLRHDIPSLFIYNAFLVMSDLSTTKAGTITAGEDRFMEWKTTDGAYENTRHAQFGTLLLGMFEKKRFLDILKNFICFLDQHKILGAYHQYFAVNKAVASTVSAATTGDPARLGKSGVFWHTQGSGKSLSMVFYAHLLQDALPSPTIVVLTDRNDLDGQLFAQFAKCADFLRQKPERAESRAHLRELLADRQVNGIIFATMQKFEESAGPLSARRNIVVIADEAHRTQFVNEAVTVSGRVQKSFALLLRESLPNAAYIGFTGTPIDSKDRSTLETFGNYIDIYDMTQSVADGATRPVYYESRVMKLRLNDSVLREIDGEYERMVLREEAAPETVERSKRALSQMDSILGADETIAALCDDIVSHYEQHRRQELTGKAMIVAYSRAIAVKIFRRLLFLRPAWKKKLAAVITADNNDPEDWRDITGDKRHRDGLAKKFKDDKDPLKIAIVVDMWLTGFDVPSLATMYVYKPMSGHNLMQAIARVNRVFSLSVSGEVCHKEGGLVVDYVGIAAALKQAMSDYTRRDRQNYGDQDIRDTALLKFTEKLEVCRDLFHGFDYSLFLDKSIADLQRADLIVSGANFLSAPGREKQKDAFIKESLLLRQAQSLCRSLLSSQWRAEAAYFEAVRTLLTRIVSGERPLSLGEINDRINELLKSSIRSEGVINLFATVSGAGGGFSLFDPQFLAEIARLKQRNLAVEMLKKLLAEQVKIYRRTNLVKSEKFSAMLARIMTAYLNGMITNEEVITELLKMAQEMSAARADGQQLGLTEEEQAFYDAITRPEAVKDFYQNAELIAMTRELTEQLRKNRTIDWQQKETARARMRRMVKKLLKDHRYPPEGMDDAITTVIGQCELWVDN